jgi:hypothetical protein
LPRNHLDKIEIIRLLKMPLLKHVGRRLKYALFERSEFADFSLPNCFKAIFKQRRHFLAMLNFATLGI